MMIIEVKYGVGDAIKYLKKKRKEIIDECPCCGGTGNVEGVDGNLYDCGYCDSTGFIETGRYEEEVEELIGTISSVHVAYDSNIARKGQLGKVQISYCVPQSYYNIMQEDIIEKIESE